MDFLAQMKRRDAELLVKCARITGNNEVFIDDVPRVEFAQKDIDSGFAPRSGVVEIAPDCVAIFRSDYKDLSELWELYNTIKEPRL